MCLASSEPQATVAGIFTSLTEPVLALVTDGVEAIDQTRDRGASTSLTRLNGCSSPATRPLFSKAAMAIR
jgi:hypothetical protein